MTDPSDELTIEQIARLLRATAETLRAEAEAIGEEGLRWRPEPGEWCVNEVVGHLIEAESRAFTERIRQIVEQPGRKLETWDQVEVARNRQDCDRGGLDLVREFLTTRDDSVRMLAGLAPEQLRLSGDHPEIGEMRIGEMVHHWIHHDRAHVKQVLSIAQARVWPHMGSAQRFA